MRRAESLESFEFLRVARAARKGEHNCAEVRGGAVHKQPATKPAAVHLLETSHGVRFVLLWGQPMGQNYSLKEKRNDLQYHM